MVRITLAAHSQAQTIPQGRNEPALGLPIPPKGVSPMTDGHTGFQVAPITEDDMNRVHSILTRAVDAIVGVSQLSKYVEAMQGQLAQMTDELPRHLRTNDVL